MTHKQQNPTKPNELALPLSGCENLLPSFGSWFPHLRLSWRFSSPLRQLGKVPDGTGSSQVVQHSVLERKPNSQDEELPFNTYLVIMLIFKPRNQSKSKSHLNGIYGRIRKWRKWEQVSKPIWFNVSPFPFFLYHFLTGYCGEYKQPIGFYACV